MYKKLFILFSVLILHVSASFGAVQLKVSSQQEFRTDNPSEYIKVKVNKDTTLGKYELKQNDILKCKVLQVVDPKRGKRNAVFYVQPVCYSDYGKVTQINDEYYGKYSKTVLSKEEIKNLPKGKIVKGAALAVGSYFIKGLSTGVSFAQGVIQNEEDNRLKSGVVQAYKDSPLSYVEKGEQLDINIGDEFYLVFKLDNDEDDEPNYSYTPHQE